MTKTITLNGAEVAVALDGAHAHIRNDSADIIYAAKTAGITAGADGVASIPAGQADTVRGITGKVYLLGTGSVHIQSDDYAESPFKTSAQAGGSGADEVARAAINAHAGNAEIHITAAEKAEWNAKAELSDIPKTLPANGGNSDTVGGKSLTELVNCETARQLTTSINSTDLIGTYSCESSYTPDYPTEAGIGYYGLLDVRRYGSIVYQTMMFENGVIIHRAILVGTTDWTDWQRLNDGGNAASVGAYTESAIAALEARIAALEEKAQALRAELAEL